MMLDIFFHTKFKKDFKRCEKRSKDLGKLDSVIEFLVADEELPEKYGDHSLVGNYKGFRECHLEADWLLIYKKTETAIFLVRLGTHADLFRK